MDERWVIETNEYGMQVRMVRGKVTSSHLYGCVYGGIRSRSNAQGFRSKARKLHRGLRQ